MDWLYFEEEESEYYQNDYNMDFLRKKELGRIEIVMEMNNEKRVGEYLEDMG